MSESTNIEWCDSTFNPWIGCTKVSPACDDCYAARSTPARALGVAWGPHEPRRRTSDATWREPLRWQKYHHAFEQHHGRRRRVFCASLSDVFDNAVPAEWREDLFELIRLTPSLDWLLLTKRPQNIVKMVRESGAIAGNGTRYLPEHVWLGATAEDQKRADLNLPPLLATRAQLGARILFMSIEPMLGAIDLQTAHTRACPNGDCFQSGGRRFVVDSENGGTHEECICSRLNGLDWVICGGESGPKARPMHPDWARSLRDQCAAAGVPFMFKQWGEWGPDWEGAETCSSCGMAKFELINEHGECGRCGVDDWTPATKPIDTPRRVGKKAAGRLLDGVEHNGFPRP